MTTKTFTDIVNAVSDNKRKDYALATAKQFDDRVAFEKQEHPNNLTIEKKLDKSRAKLAMPSAAAVLMAAQVDVTFINRSINKGKRYNVYAFDKAADLVQAMTSGEIKNAVNNAITRSMFKFRAAGVAFTGAMAKAATSDKIRVEPKVAAMMVRHNVDAKTADTQSSSTMNALETLGIVKNTGSFKFPVYELTATPQTTRLQELLAA